MTAKKYSYARKEGFIDRKVSGFLRSLKDDRPKRYCWKKESGRAHARKVVRHARMFHVRYGNLALVVLGVAGGVWLVLNPAVLSFMVDSALVAYASSFAVGMLYAFGVTTAAAVAGFFLLGRTVDPVALALLGALGAVASNYLVYRFIRHKIADYMDSLASRYMRVNLHIMRMRVQKHPFLRHIVPIFAGIMLASPLPSEMAIGIFAAIKFEMKRFLVYTFAFNLLSIFLISQLGAVYHIIV